MFDSYFICLDYSEGDVLYVMSVSNTVLNPINKSNKTKQDNE